MSNAISSQKFSYIDMSNAISSQKFSYIDMSNAIRGQNSVILTCSMLLEVKIQ